MSDQAWSTQSLGSLAQIEMGQSPPSEYVTDHASSNSWPFLQGNAEFGEVHPIPRLWCSRPAKIAHTGDVLISVRAPVGDINVADLGYCIGRGLAAIRFRSVEARFGYHQLAFRGSQLHRVAQGSTFDAIGSKELRELEFFTPNPSEQHLIAEILDTLDDQIRTAEQVVKKLQHLRTGLLGDLIMAREGHTHDDVLSGPLDTFVSWLSGGTPSKDARQFWGGSIPWLTPKDMKSLVVVRTADTLMPLGVATGSRLAPTDAVFIVVRGMILAHTFPVSRTATAAAFNQDIKAVVPRSGILSNYLMYWFVAHADTMLRLVGESTHGTKKLDLPDLKAVPAVFPTPDEQARVLSILEVQERAIDRGIETATKLRLQKAGLLTDLLSGHVGTPLEAA